MSIPNWRNEAGRVGDDVAEAACHVYGTADHLLNLGGCQCVDASGRCRQGRIVGRSDSNREGLSLNGDTKKQRGNGHCETHDLRAVVAGEAELYLLTWEQCQRTDVAHLPLPLYHCHMQACLVILP